MLAFASFVVLHEVQGPSGGAVMIGQKAAFAGIAAMLLWALAGCSDPVPEEPPAPTVLVEPVQVRTLPLYTGYVGRTEASQKVEVRARVPGFLERRTFTEGSEVQKGDLLFLIDRKPFEAKVRQLEAQVERRQASLAKTERDVNRLRPLYERNAASQLDYDNALSAREEAESELVSARAELEQAQLELSYTEIKAPLNGLVGAREVSTGALVGPGGKSLLTTVQQVDPMWVTFNMTATEYLKVRRAQETKGTEEGEPVPVGSLVDIYLPDGSLYEYSGDIEFTDPSINPRTATFQVRAEIDNPDRLLLPGQFVQVKLLRSYRYNALLVPEKSQVIEQGGAYVFVVGSDNIVEKRFIDVGGRHETSILVDRGLEEGEQVIVEGMHKVQHGQKVRIVDRDAEEQDGPDAKKAATP